MKLDNFTLQAMQKAYSLPYKYEYKTGEQTGIYGDHIISFEYKDTHIYLWVQSIEDSVDMEIILKLTENAICEFERVLEDANLLAQSKYIEKQLPAIYAHKRIKDGGMFSISSINKLEDKVGELFAKNQNDFITTYKTLISDETRKELFEENKA